MSRYFFGNLRKSTISVSSCLASLSPATSLKVMRSFIGCMRLTFALPNENAWLMPPFARLLMKKIMPTMIMSGRSVGIRMLSQNAAPDSPWTSIFTPASASELTLRPMSVSTSPASVSFLEVKFSPLFETIARSLPLTVMLVISCAFIFAASSLRPISPLDFSISIEEVIITNPRSISTTQKKFLYSFFIY